MNQDLEAEREALRIHLRTKPSITQKCVLLNAICIWYLRQIPCTWFTAMELFGSIDCDEMRPDTLNGGEVVVATLHAWGTLPATLVPHFMRGSKVGSRSHSKEFGSTPSATGH